MIIVSVYGSDGLMFSVYSGVVTFHWFYCFGLREKEFQFFWIYCYISSGLLFT